MTISAKIYLLFLIVLAIFLSLGGYVVLEVGRLGALQDAGATLTAQALSIKDIGSRVGAVYAVVADAQINRNLMETRNEWVHIKQIAEEDIRAVSTLTQTTGQSTAETFAAQYRQYLAFFEGEMLPLLEKIVAQKVPSAADEQKDRELDGEIDELRNKALASLAIINESLMKRSEASDETFDAVRKSIAQTLIVMFTLASVLIAGAAFLLTRSITSPLRVAVAVAHRIAEGDLTVDIDITTKDEIGQLLQAMATMAGQLKNIVADVMQSVEQVNIASTRIARGNTELSQRTEAQATALEETSASMEAITDTVKKSAENTHHATELANAACGQAEEGGAAIQQTINAMRAINESSQKIADIIGVVDEIAFQTNLLALNAAVEAARAGEQGKSFAIVAAEVRKLAQRSADASKEIRGLTTESLQKVQNGEQSVEKSARMLDEIVASVKKVNQIVAEMAAAAIEQASSIEQTNQAILEMDQSTQQNAALVQQMDATSQAMSQQSTALQQLMGFFRVGAAAPKMRAAAMGQRAPIAVMPSDSAALITWSDDLSVSDAEIDRQHQQLISLINQLNEAMRNGSTRKIMGDIFSQLIEYTAKHFTYEEGRMETCHYPQIADHKKKHTDLVKKVLAFQEKFASGDNHINMQLMRFLKEWITNHILKSDKHYAPYLQEDGGKN